VRGTREQRVAVATRAIDAWLAALQRPES